MSMYYSLLADAPKSTDAGWMADAATAASEAAAVPSLPRRPRAGAAVASVTVTCALFASVVLGMTSMAQDGDPLVAQAHSVPRS
jgi:hypothetical protein